MVGWAIEQGKTVIIQEGKQEVVKFNESLEGGGLHERSCQNWGPLLFFMKKVGLQIVILVNQGNSHFHYLGAINTYILLHIHACIIHGNQLPTREQREPQEPMGTWELYYIRGTL